MDDGASLYWRLGGTAAQGANDLVGNNDAIVRSGVTSNSGGALPSEPGPSYNFNGTTSGFLNSTSHRKRRAAVLDGALVQDDDHDGREADRVRQLGHRHLQQLRPARVHAE